MTLSKAQFTIVLLSMLLTSCGGSNPAKEYNLGKKFWTLEDYESAIHKIRYVYRDEVKPSHSTPDK